jgi:hypothetical protein
VFFWKTPCRLPLQTLLYLALQHVKICLHQSGHVRLSIHGGSKTTALSLKRGCRPLGSSVGVESLELGLIVGMTNSRFR